jgi:alpha-1,3-rhamnosyl/mannosyltransferase
LEEKKNTANLVHAWDILHSLDDKYREYDLLLVGKPGYGYGAVQEAVAQSPYKDRIRVLGWTEESHMYAIMHGAVMFVHPSMYEGFGIPLIEAMASRVPVVAVRGSGAVEEVGGDVITYAVDHTSLALVNAIHGLAQDSNRCKVLKERGYIHAQKYSWSLCAQSTWQVMSSDSVER